MHRDGRVIESGCVVRAVVLTETREEEIATRRSRQSSLIKRFADAFATHEFASHFARLTDGKSRRAEVAGCETRGHRSLEILARNATRNGFVRQRDSLSLARSRPRHHSITSRSASVTRTAEP